MNPRLRELYGHAVSNPGTCRRAAMHLWLYNVGVGVLVGTNYLVHLPDGSYPSMWVFALLALVSTVLFLTLIPGLLHVLLARIVRHPRFLGAAQGLVWTVFHVLLFVDTRIYNIFKYHLNGQVWNLVYTRGSEDAIHLGWQVWSAVTFGLAAMMIIEHLLWRRAIRLAVEDETLRATAKRLARPAFIWGAILLPAVFVEKTIYAASGFGRDRQVTALSRLFPLYPALHVDDVASMLLGVEMNDRPRLELEGLELDYPLASPRVDPYGPRPNILLIVLDCWRADMLGPQSSPNAWFFSQDSRRFDDHVSGGNSTRYGLMSMLYGLHGSYWFPILNERASPVLVDVLLELGYELGVFSSATQSYPELRQTAWSRVAESVHDDFPGPEPWARDDQSGAALIDWLNAPERRERPFFGFILLDSPHQTYSSPPGEHTFSPSAGELDYMAMTANRGPDLELLERVINRYRNAVRHSDGVVGRILEAVEHNGFRDDTLVIVTGDHGEEFRENGFFGHTSAFTSHQVRVPLLLRGPGIEPGVESNPTSHIDLAPTLLELLGADPEDRHLWTLGENLLEPRSERRRVMSGWNELGMWVPAGIIRIPLSNFDIEVYDRAWRLITDDAEILSREAEALEELAAECNRFLR